MKGKNSSVGLRTPIRPARRKINSAKNRVLRSFSVSSKILTAVSVNVTLLWEKKSFKFADKKVSAKSVASIIKVDV